MRYYLTTAIPYVNAKPHLGFVLEIIQADAYARFLRIQNEEVRFLTGADENSLKNVVSAQEKGISPQELVDINTKAFQDLKDLFNISYDDFIRTTEVRHRKGVEKLWETVFQKGDIYKKKYKGLYCVGCETFYKPEELVNGLCPIHKTKPEVVEEENYFFKLSNYQNQLVQLIQEEKLEIYPAKRKNEILHFVKSGLEDFSISRSQERAKNWGIPVPNDNSQVIYVWFDALSNYISALNYADKEVLFDKWWNNSDKIIHFIGKGITRFHAVYWPAMLLSAQLRLPSTIFVHGYLTINGQKISKSLGGTIDPFVLAQNYQPEVIRYFLLREFSSFEDGDFSEKRLRERYNSDLAQGLGNLLSRILALGEQFEKEISLSSADPSVIDAVLAANKEYSQLMYQFRFNDALARAWLLLGEGDKLISQSKPWEKIKEEREFQKIMGSLIFLLGNVSLMIAPAMPQVSDTILTALQLKDVPSSWLEKKVLLKKGKQLFPKLD